MAAITTAAASITIDRYEAVRNGPLPDLSAVDAGVHVGGRTAGLGERAYLEVAGVVVAVAVKLSTPLASFQAAGSYAGIHRTNQAAKASAIARRMSAKSCPKPCHMSKPLSVWRNPRLLASLKKIRPIMAPDRARQV